MRCVDTSGDSLLVLQKQYHQDHVVVLGLEIALGIHFIKIKYKLNTDVDRG
jgi:hypothetical protein